MPRAFRTPGSKSFRRENVSVPNADGARCESQSICGPPASFRTQFPAPEPGARHRADIESDFHWNEPSLNLLPGCFRVAGEVVMSRLYVRPPQYDWGYDWFDDCPPPRVTFTHRPARLAVQLPPCKPHAGINTDWRSGKCAVLHNDYSSYALLPAPSVQSQASLPAPPPAQPEALQPAPPAQPEASQPAAPAQPTPPKPAAEPVTVGQATHDHVHQEPVVGISGFDVAVGLGLALAFVAVLRLFQAPRH
jgi:hypothetical protein